MIRKILTLGVTGMALAALAGMATGCTGDDDDDDGGPGGVMVLGRTSSDGISASYSYAEFYSDFVGTPSSIRDIPLDGCIDAFATSTSGTPTYLDVGATITATGAVTATYDRDIAGTEITYSLAADIPAGTAGDYDAATETFGALGTISVPADPGSVTGAAGGAVTWTAGSSDETLILVAATNFSEVNLCRTANDGSYTVPFATLGLTSGLAGITVLNFSEADLEGRTVSLVGQSGDPTFDMALWTD